MVAVKRFDHVGVVVDDMPLVAGFFADLGFEIGTPMYMEGDWIGKVIGLPDVKTEIQSVGVPGAGTWLELAKYHQPVDPDGPTAGPSNKFGLRHLCFEVDDVDAAVAQVRAKGLDIMDEVVDYEGIYRLCFVRGPEGLIVELAQRIDT